MVSTWPSAQRPSRAERRLRPGAYRLIVWSGVGSRERKNYMPRPWLSAPLVLV